MAANAGKKCKVVISAATVALIGDFALDINAALSSKEAFGDDWKSNLVGLRDWSGSFSGRLDLGDTNGQVALQNAILNDTLVTLKLYNDATHYYSGSAYLSKMNIKAAVAGNVDVSFNFTGDGALSWT